MIFTKVQDVKTPTGNRTEDSGIDFFVPNDFVPTKLYIGEQINISSGIKVVVPTGWTLKIDNKSGVSTKRGTTCGATIVDPSYRGILHINLHKGVKGSEDKQDENGWYAEINPGDKIAQGLLLRCSDEELQEVSNEEYETYNTTSRGDKGFGEGTGTK
jgi:dUTPase